MDSMGQEDAQSEEIEDIDLIVQAANATKAPPSPEEPL